MVVKKASWRKIYKDRKDGQGVEKERLFSSRRGKGTSVQGHSVSKDPEGESTFKGIVSDLM